MRALIVTTLVLVLGTSVAGAVPAPEVLMPWELVDCNDNDAVHELTEVFPDPTVVGGIVTVHLICYAPGAGSGGVEACSSSAYALTGYEWNGKYTAKADPTNSDLGASGVLSALGQSGSAWDSATSGSIWGGVTQNSGGGNAGKRDGVNQIGFKSGGNYIAVTYTWSSGGIASESDQRYNTLYPWSLSGEANKMDVQNIATHEMGHSFGLGHPSSTNANSCLTMYAYADYGETQKRSLENGDKAGIGALYG